MQLIFDIVFTVMALGVIAQFIWAMNNHFKTEGLKPAAKLVTLISGFTILLDIYLQFRFSQPLGAFLAALPFLAAAQWLFASSVRTSSNHGLHYAFEGKRPESLLTNGPYRHIRHPFYSSYLLLWSAWAIATWSLIAILPVVALIGLYVRAALQEERGIAETSLANEYEQYRRKAGLFWPRLPS